MKYFTIWCKPPIFIVLIALITTMSTGMAAGSSDASTTTSSSPEAMPDVAAPQIGDPVSEAELRDLRTVAQ